MNQPSSLEKEQQNKWKENRKKELIKEKAEFSNLSKETGKKVT